MILQALRAEVNSLKNGERAKQMMRYFKTGPGEYGEGDIFVGLSNPQCKSIAKNHQNISIEQVEELIQSEIHEERAIALLLMTQKFKSKKNTQKDQIYSLYLKRMHYVNNWDLVDMSAPHIVGSYLLAKSDEAAQKNHQHNPKQILYEWVQSPNMWFRRIAIISTFTFIRANQFTDTLQLTKRLLKDKEDIIHKASGWMLREVGKRDQILLEDYLKVHYKDIPRTALRYAIQKFEEGKRKDALKGIFAMN